MLREFEVEAETLLFALAHTVAEIESERVGDMKVKTLIDRLPDTL